MRWFVLSCVLLASIGCKQPSTLDPFSAYGPATINPPPTGTAGRDDPYYRKTLSSNQNRYGPSAQTVFTSEQNIGGVEIADQRGSTQAGLNDSSSKMQWRSPVNDAYSKEPYGSDAVGSGRARPRLPSSRRLGRASSPAADEPVIINQGIAGASGGLDGSYQGLPPTPRVDQQVAPATFQQPAPTGSGWQSRY